MANKIYLIQYNIEDGVLENRVKSLGRWMKYFSNNWIVETNKSAMDVYKLLTEDMENKSIFIIELDPKNYYGRMNPKLWDFIKEHRKNNI